MRKGISATNLIVALAVGLIVIVGLGYLVWTWLGRGGGQVNQQFCNGQLLTYCTRWSANGYDPDGVSTFGGKKTWVEYEPKCQEIPGFGGDVEKTQCQELLGQKED